MTPHESFFQAVRPLALAIALQFLAVNGYGQEQERPVLPHYGLSSSEAEALEKSLVDHPDDLSMREHLISYYFEAAIESHATELEKKREQHVLWLIEHHPESEFAGSPEAFLMPAEAGGSPGGYENALNLWRKQTEMHGDDARILINAAHFAMLSDERLAQGFLEKALVAHPDDIATLSLLAKTYERQTAMAHRPEEKTAFARKAMEIRDRSFEKVHGDERFYELSDVAKTAFEAGLDAKAEEYADELLHMAEERRGDWNYGNAVHNGNIVLGRLALKRGDINGAKEHLAAAGKTSGSPQLDSFGPNMTLAKELLAKGERNAVLAYFEDCAKFWDMGRDELKNWTSTVKAGGTPEFGANLKY